MDPLWTAVREKKTSPETGATTAHARLCMELRLFLRLFQVGGTLEYRLRFRVPRVSRVLRVLPALTTAHRFVQQINGRDYRIEVTQLAASRWRAQVLNAFGGPSALMPFYDVTPDEALGRLTDWLSLAHRSVAGPS